MLIALGFLLFAGDETDKGSRGQVSKIDDAINAPDPTQQQELLRQRQHGEVREAIDDANDFLLKPFAPLVEDSGSTWARRGVPTRPRPAASTGSAGCCSPTSCRSRDTKQRDWRGVPT